MYGRYLDVNTSIIFMKRIYLKFFSEVVTIIKFKLEIVFNDFKNTFDCNISSDGHYSKNINRCKYITVLYTISYYIYFYKCVICVYMCINGCL